MNEFHELTVDINDIDVGKRLDLYLSLNISDYSRSFIKKTIETNQVYVNDKLNFKAGYKVQPGDRIRFPKLNQSTSFDSLEPSDFDLEVILEDKDYLFIQKPIGISVHPANPNEKDTVVNKLLSRYENLPGNNMARPGIVHRLDKDTSGVLAIAKTPKALWWLSGRFAERKVEKKYVSIGIGENKPKYIIDNAEFEVNGFMKRSSENRKQFALFPNETSNARYSLTKFRVQKIKRVDSHELVLFEVSPKTGRTHQIRVHQKSFNLPILGDKLYLSKSLKTYSDEILSNSKINNRLFLHSNSLSFENYDGKIYSITSVLPPEFEKIMS